MAYQTRGREPLLDSTMAEAIEKRGKELMGLVLLIMGAMAAAMIVSYHPDDPSWMSATDAPVQNWMGRFGASIAAPLFMIVGWGAWGLAIVLGVWGTRFALHRGAERAVSRLIFAPIWIALLALYAASLTPGAVWSATHSFGLGGMFGDAVLGTVLGILPLGASLGLKVLSLALGIGVLGFGAFVLGSTWPELMRLGRFLLVGVILTYAWVMALAGRGASGALNAAQRVQTKAGEARARRLADRAEAEEYARAEASVPAQPVVRRAQVPPISASQPSAAAQAPGPDERADGLLSRMPSLMRRPEPEPDPEPELIESTGPEGDVQAPGDDRIRAKIADVIKTRVRQSPAIQVESVAPLTRGRGRGPDPLILNSGMRGTLPPEPPLTAAKRQEWSEEPPLVEPEARYDSFEQPDLPQPEPQPQAIQPRIPVAEPKKVVQHTQRRAPQPSSRAIAEAQPALQFEESAQVEYDLPPLSLLNNPANITRHHLSDDALEENARMLENVLDDYGVKGEIVSVRPGPVVTMYELEPAPGLKASRVIGLADDIARSMSALSARVSTVPGRSVIGIELPNDNREMVSFREILSSRDYGDGNQKLPLALGKDIGGDPVVQNLAKMPHLLIAGTTGSGKSVAINTMILSLLYKLTPDECRLIMIDPKMLELSVYDGIPHLLSPVVTDPKKAVVALKWVVAEMEERYRKMSKMGVRNIDGYNGRVADAQRKGEMFSRTVQTGFDDETGEPVFETEEFAPEKMPYIVVIVDEMADLMMVAGKEIEACIQRLAQMARASGIHLIMATQRPSVDVITGTIKANFPTRISFQVTSKIDSRTILGEMGAEQLLGMGDMLYMAGGGKITRCHGPFVSDEEVEEVVNHLKAYGPPTYVNGVQDGPDDEKADSIDAVLGLSTGGNTDGEDALYDQAVAIVIKDRKCSTSYIQRKLAIGYNKAARLVEQMEEQGIVSPANHVGKRDILVPEQ
ncbi:DNA translocase FtsK [Roseovarius halotolerans]|uniref:DNA translocase FtsK n=1 Tax=Roseovarius halotolerans TaxID=505353 RepID=A0A1X6ZR45_9RHOB|nr:DNA translocase FtsK [Roseovarius halotolerans]RKT27971.1 DNA translocase FtsK [Roseovarius halotolerans]SLN58811.1 DNA translocase FtsK [Roseovarius halotolerans]